MRPLIAATVLGASLAVPFAAAAQSPTEQAQQGAASEDPSEERAAQFVGVEGAEAERIPGGVLLLSAYAIAWVLLLLYLFRMRRLQRQTAVELERLSDEVRASGGR